MENVSDLVSVRQVLATETRLREVREAMHALIPVESQADLSALEVRLAQVPIDAEAAQLAVLGEELAVLERRVLEESLRALGEIGFDAAAIAVIHALDGVRQGDAASAEGLH